MSAPKGYPTQVKDGRVGAQFATVEPVDGSRYGLTVNAQTFNFVVGTDAVEANADVNTNRYRINATAHAALKGDTIRFTSGTHSGREVKVASIATNYIDLVEEFSVAPSAADTFEILRPKAPVINADGTLFTASAGNISFLLDGSSQVVTEDTVTPANNAPLPVKLTSVTGDINITAGDLNVQTSHAGASYDSVRIGDGTDLLAVNADGSINVVSAESATAADGALGLPAVSKVVAGYDGANVRTLHTDAAGDLQVDVLTLPSIPAGTNNIGDVDVLSLPSIPAGTNNIGDVDVLTQPARSHTTDSIRIGDGTDLANVTAANQLEVAVTAALPAGTNNIGDVDVLSQPVRSHTTDSIRIGDGTDLVNVTAANQLEVAVTASLPAGTNNIGDVDVLSQPARSHTTDSVRIGDGTDLLLVTAAGEALVSLTTALPAGTNNIGDVDVLSLPSIPAGTNNIGDVDVLTQPARSHTTDSIRIGDGTDLANVTAANQLEVAVTAALPAGTNNIGDVDVLSLPSLDIVDFLDTPLLDASSTNIPASASTPLTVVASLAAAVKKIQILDTTGSFIGLYSDPAGTPVLEAIIGPGSDSTIEVALPATTVLGLRNMENSAIAVGNVAINFMG